MLCEPPKPPWPPKPPPYGLPNPGCPNCWFEVDDPALADAPDCWPPPKPPSPPPRFDV